MRIKLGLATAAAALLTWSAAHAVELALINADFSQGLAQADGAYVPGHVAPLPGWTGSSGSGTGHWNPTQSHFAAEAEYGGVGFATGVLEGHPSAGVLAQTLANYVIQPNTRYTLTLDVGRPYGTPAFGYHFGLIAGLGAEGSVLASRPGFYDVQEGAFQSFTLVFDTGASGAEIGRTLSVALGGNNQFGGGAAYDNIRLDATSLSAGAVPEPGAWALMISGFGLAGAMIRRRRTLALA